MPIIDWIRRSNTLSKAHTFFSFYKSYIIKDLYRIEMKSLFIKVRPYTMASYERLRNVYLLAEAAENKRLEGAFVECGVWKGGCAGVMAYVSKQHNSKRSIHLFDSFEGLPAPSEKDGRKAASYMDNVIKGKYSERYKCDASIDLVRELFFEKLNILPTSVHFHKGWFKSTIPFQKTQIDSIAILRLDADWYESTKLCLVHLYDKVVDGGFVILDDYGYWEGCRKAVDEFIKEQNLNIKLFKIDKSGYYFTKLAKINGSSDEATRC